ncbi:MAG: MFS transporter [Deltaproteobacteria bacterium]|nr:MFS transporter [Deltaproteobacteria bacterium]
MRPKALLFIALFNSILGLSVLFPIMAPLGRQLGLGELEVGALSTGYSLMQFASAAFWGRKSEEKGRKPILLVGILGFAGTFLAFALVCEAGMRGWLDHGPLFGLLLTTRVLGGLLSSATFPTAQAYMADITDREDRTSGMALIGAAFGLGIIFGPAIGAALSYVSLLAAVYFSVAVAVLNALFVYTRLPEPERHREREPGDQRAVFRRIWPLLAVGVVATVASVAMEQTIAFYYQDRLALDEGETARAVGMALVLYGVVAVFVQGYLVRRVSWPPLRLMRFGLPIVLVGLVLLTFSDTFATLTGALLLQGIGQGLALPGITAFLSLSVADNEQGAVAGLNSAAQGLGRTIGPLLGTALYELGPTLPYWASATLVTVVVLYLWTSPRVRRLGDAAQAEAEESATQANA